MAHATMASLMRTMQSLLMSNSPMDSLICNHREEFHALHEKVSSLEVFLKNFEKNNSSGRMTDLEAEIKEVGTVVEHIVQLRVTEVVTENDEMLRGKAHEKLSDSLRQVGEDIDRVWKESTMIQDKGKQSSKDSLVQDFSSSTKDILNVKNNMVGRDEQRERLFEDLTRDYSGEPKVIPIIGMGGIGKTTLAREVYNDGCIRSHFDVCAWATVSQQYNKKVILLSLLRSTKGDTCDMDDEAELRDMLQKSLKGKRYLIVMDDIWSSKVWDDVRLCFPSENNNAGSRILLTTRNNEVACYAGTENRSLELGFMDQDESWKLFKSAASANEALPSEFEAIGRRIAEKCHGVPLTIVVVAGLLRSKRTIEDWESVAKDVKSFVANDPDEQCLHVLELSYNHLTSDLKACLLYFGIFPEDSEIPVKSLMGFWMAEGFLNLEKDLEREAEKCLQELVDRCLVLVGKKSLDEKKIRSCKVHDLIYDLCLREVQRGNVFVMNDIVLGESDDEDILCDLCEPSDPSESYFLSRMKPFKRRTSDDIDGIQHGLYKALLIPEHHPLTDDDNNNLLERTRSISHWTGDYTTIFLESELLHFKLLKFLDLDKIEINGFPFEILSLIWLRYLSLFSYEDLYIPPEICRLWNLQTFIVRHPFSTSKAFFPKQIWELMQLRHLKNMDSLYTFVLPDCPSISVDRGKNTGFSNMQTISGLSPNCCTKEVMLGIQNVKKLGIRGNDENPDENLWNNLVHLHQLESLSLVNFTSKVLPSANVFPATLKKLKLEETNLRWSNLDIIAELPNLEVLKLMYNSCCGEEWDPNVSVFARLKILLFESHELKYWKATDDNFPVLERLFIVDCELKEIPIEFADIQSLQLIELEYYYPTLAASAERIQQEQEDLGNNPVVVIIKSPRWPSSDDDDDDDGGDDGNDEDDDDEDEDDDGNEDDDGGGVDLEEE